MGKLVFDGEAVREQVEHARRCTNFRKAYGQESEPALFLVHDHGVYLMSAGIPHLERPDKPESSKVVYAEGCNPDTQEFNDWWENSRELVGGDDFVEMIPLEHFTRLFDSGLQDIRIVINLSADKLVVSFTGGRKIPKARRQEAKAAAKRPTKKSARLSTGIDALDDL